MNKAILEGCKYIELPQLLSFIVDNRGKSVPTCEKGIKLIATNCIKNTSLYPVFENVRYLSQETYDTWFRAHPLPGDIIFVNKGSPGRVCLVPDPVDFCIAQDMMAFRVDDEKIYNKYLFAVLRSDHTQRIIANGHVGTLIPHFKKSHLNQLIIPVPDRDIQEKIGNIYFTLSNKIELNTRMNKVLEEIARALFHRWFVEFEFPNAEGKPYKSAGGKMVESEMGSVPEGWRVDKLEQLIELSYGKPLKEENRTGSGYPVFGSNGVVGWHNEWMVTGPGIIVGRKGNAGTVTWSHENFFPIDTTFFVCPIMSKYGKYGLHFLYLLLKTLNLPHLTSDSAVPGLNRNTALIQKIIIPNIYTVNEFELIVSSLFSQIYALELENKTLISFRDTLLPKLMSGELSI